MKAKSALIVCLTIWATLAEAQTINPFIIVDQFGYLPESQKIAVLKDPQTGFDAALAYTPGPKFIVADAATGAHVYFGQSVIWNSGATDASSGDKVWHFDFTSFTETGRYYILDSLNNQRSYEFEISPDIYREVLKHAVRTFFYQRVGFDKDAEFAGAAWADSASHMGPLQDKNCRRWDAKTNAATERDLSGGWYDAGDYNKYTSWTANYVVEMMKAYIENPRAWGDDYNIPESGNGIPDLLDEAKWGIDHLLRMQQADGGVLCIVSEDGASPPSLAKKQSVYGPATTSASFNTAAAFAIAARVYRSMNMIAYSDTLVTRAEKAWKWGVANPAVIFHNNKSEYGTQGVGAGDQEEDDYTRSMSKLEAACYLFEATRKTEYRTYFNQNYSKAHLFEWNYAYPYEPLTQDMLLYYTRIPGATTTVSNAIRNTYKNAMLNNSENFPAFDAVKDPYLAHMENYTWGSNNQKGAQGSMFYNMIHYNLDAARNQDARDAALGYVHYIHGVNPLNLAYLSNMYAYGADSCVNEFYHTWFSNGSPRWDRVGTSLYGPAPGFVPGGPNPSYNWDGCCDDPANCGSSSNTAICSSENLSPPKDQPKQKSYKDFNTSWPLNSWSVTENSCGYQVSYLKLLSKFVDGYDCHGDLAGTATFDQCGICSGGNTGRVPADDPCDCPVFSRKSTLTTSVCEPLVSPSGKYEWTVSGVYTDTVPATDGCDSVITVNLTVGQPSAGSLSTTSCDEFTSPSGKYTWNITGTYADTIPNAAGCDSVITIDLEIIHSTESEITLEACDFWVSPAGKKLTATGHYTDTLSNAAGCDSIIYINLTIPLVDVTVTQTEDTLFAAASDATFRWLDCTNEEMIEGATANRFTPAVSGSYAVEVTQGECKDTSACFSVTITGIFNNTLGDALQVFPNPAGALLTIILPEAYDQVFVEISSLSGQLALKQDFSNRQRLDVPLSLKAGLYLLSIRNNRNQGALMKLVIR
ncbi:MAG: glycoside hydrolase family 9 protein [Bacteroidales bacterium]